MFSDVKKRLVQLANFSLDYPKTVLITACIACAFSLYYTANNLKVNTDTSEIVSSDLPFQQDRQRFLDAFPQDDQAILVVVDAQSPEQTNRALAYMGKRFRDEDKEITSVYIPGEGTFFDNNGLLYLDDLKDLAKNLTEAQPFIGTLSKDNSLKGLLSIIELALNEKERELPVDINFFLDKIRTAIRANLEGKDYRLSWQAMMFSQENGVLTTQRFILLKPKLDFSSMTPAEKPLKSVRAIVEKTKPLFPDTRIRLTGEVVLEDEELVNVSHSAAMASFFSVILVCISLMIGYRSVKLTIATLVVMLMGTILTAGFAAFAIGQLNLISISFAVLYIGISDDYSVQLCLRYRELLQQNLPKKDALITALKKVLPATTLCAITAAIGFFSFIPTAYSGVSELGIIAGTGIFIALVISMVVLPALLNLMYTGLPQVRQTRSVFPDWVYRFPVQHRIIIRWLAVGLTLAGLVLLMHARFDFNPLNLRDPESESITTFKELLKTKETSPMTLTVLADNKTQALATAQLLNQQPSVEHAITIFDYLPDNQQEKIAIIEELNLVLGLHMDQFPPLHFDPVDTDILALSNLQKTIENKLATSPDSPLAATLRLLNDDLGQYLASLASAPELTKKARLEKLQISLLDTLQDTMNRLIKGLQAGPVSIETLPQELRERWLNQDGVYRIMVFPNKDLNDIGSMKQFISEVKKIAPHATDLPVIYLETGNAVVKAFQQALFTSLMAIIFILLITQRSLRDTFLILLPLLMAAVFTGASTVLMDHPFNYANIIIIPLLFGLGADAGIFIIHRLRTMPSQTDSVLRTSTARGVVFSNLTTLCSLVSMAFTTHLGLASMGQLLTIGMALMLFCTLWILPAYAWRRM